jgi:hypothetical protein
VAGSLENPLASTLGVTPAQVEQECIEAEEDELAEDEPPDDLRG